MCSRKFTPSDDLLLVNSVKGFPVLYSHEPLLVTKNQEVVRENWQSVAAIVGRGEEACRRRWRDIRDHYFKVKRKQQLTKDRKWTTRWPLYKSLAFLANAKRKKKHSSGEDDLSDQSADVDIYEPETTFKVEGDSQESSQLVDMDVKTLPKREADTSYQTTSECGSIHFLEDPHPSWGPRTLLDAFAENRKQDDEDDMSAFLRSVALTVNRLPPRARAEAKLKILAVVIELEFPSGINPVTA